ncbi:MAG TPA: hypothetical protein VEV44_17135 [Pseudoneobacillus sp.]|nr:hypothetical protein [Pseudoneobacillus sp.]
MPLVTIEGVFMGASVKTSSYEGKEKSALYIDLYQPDSSDSEKMVQVKADDVSLINVLNKDFAMGSIFTCSVSVNAYKNKSYYKLLKISS